MGSLTAGEVVLLQFPFSDLSGAKIRPAVLVANAGRGDWIVCQVTSNPFGDKQSITLTQDAFESGTLARVSYARPGKLFTANERIVRSRPAHLKSHFLDEIRDAVIALLRTT